MVVELLKFKVKPEIHDKFIEIDRQVWTDMLKKCNGFIDKEVWINADNQEEILCLIKWESRQQWKSIPLDQLKATESTFAQKMGHLTYELADSSEYIFV